MEDRLYHIVHEEPYNHLECEAYWKEREPDRFRDLEQAAAPAPADFVREYGLDCILAYLRQEEEGDFDEDTVYGIFRFLGRIWRLFRRQGPCRREEEEALSFWAQAGKALRGLESGHMHVYAAGMAAMLAFLQKNGFTDLEKKAFLTLLSETAPCLAARLSEDAKGEGLMDLRALLTGHLSVFETALQVNGRTRTRILLPAQADPERAREMAGKALEESGYGTEGMEMHYVPGRIINFFSSRA